MPDTLPDSQTHRLVYFPRAPIDETLPIQGQKYVAVPRFVADEVDELREFISFLYPQRGQDRFKLCRPDILEPRWIVTEKESDLHGPRTYAGGDTPLLAIRAARARLASEHESERTLTPFSLDPQTPTD